MQLLSLLSLKVFHIFVILFVVTTPFITTDVMILLLHIVSIFSLIIHWAANNTICSLTLLESKLRGIPMEHSFIYSFIAPIYQFLHLEMISENNLSTLVYLIVILLMVFSLIKIYKLC